MAGKKPLAKQSQTIFQTPLHHYFAAGIGVVLVYALGSLALETGRLTAYFGTVIFLILTVKHAVQAVVKQRASKH